MPALGSGTVVHKHFDISALESTIFMLHGMNKNYKESWVSSTFVLLLKLPRKSFVRGCFRFFNFR